MKLDWERGHGPITGPINAAAATLAASWAGHLLDTPWPTATVITGAGLIGTHIAGRLRHVTRTTLAVRAAGWLGAGGWSSWAIANGPWTTWSLTTLAAGTVGLSIAITGAHRAEKNAPAKKAAAQEAATAAEAQAARGKVATEWQERIARVCHIPGITIANVETWESGAGFTLDVELDGGVTWKYIARATDALASDAKLPEGCGVDVTPGAHRGAALIDVSTVNRLIDDADYPSDYSPLTVNAPAPIGVRRDGTPYGPVNRQASMLLVGQRGSGKTNLMNVMVANQCRMTDSITWVIDLNGGGLALKWLRAWNEAGQPGRPPVDWVADTAEKALVMAQVLVRISKARKTGYQDREIAANDDKLPVDHDVPEIRVLNDEGAEIFSTRSRRDETLRAIAEKLVQTVEIARAAAVNVTTSGLRATQDVISDPQLLKQSTFKAGMKVADDSELNYFFGYNHGVSAADAPYPGCALVRDGDGAAHPMKIYRIRPAQILEIVKATADRRPVLDELSRNAAGSAYDHRWDGTAHLLGTGPAPIPAPATPAAPTTAAVQNPPTRSTGVTADWDTTATPKNIQDTIASADAAKKRLHDAISETTGRDNDLDRQFMDLVQQGGLTWKPPTTDTPTTDADSTTDARYAHIYRIVEGAGPDGIGPAAIIDAFTQLHPAETAPNPTVAGRWLKADDRIHQPKFGRYALKQAPNTEPSPAASAEPEGLGQWLTPEERHDLLELAAELVITTQFGSASMLQRKLRIGWAIAANLLNALEHLGIVGPHTNGQARDVLITPGHLDATLQRIRQTDA
ncbi:DNA translocase FtsK [Streptomyces gardneri]|uniref:DNA translocase FtsK n=1 Tax=Streptomyces gardneri TaxID=66892 RepID=UPI0036917843